MIKTKHQKKTYFQNRTTKSRGENGGIRAHGIFHPRMTTGVTRSKLLGKQKISPLIKGGSKKQTASFLLHKKLLAGLETLRLPNGAFIAAPSEDYRACWIRDQLYATLAYLYTGDDKKFVEGVQVVFDILENSRQKIETAPWMPPQTPSDGVHAKFHAESLFEITQDWGHHQVDALGLFLFVVAQAEANGLQVIQNLRDRELLQHIVGYLSAVRCFDLPDNGMWEENLELHASSVGAALGGLRAVKEQGLAVVSDELIRHGTEALFKILPDESASHEADLAQLSLIWPYRLLPPELSHVIIERTTRTLVQQNGINRYLGDNYYRSDNGVSAEWPMGFFWLSIIEAENGNRDSAKSWFARGLEATTPDGLIPELYRNGKPNEHTPLAWAHSLALIALAHL